MSDPGLQKVRDVVTSTFNNSSLSKSFSNLLDSSRNLSFSSSNSNICFLSFAISASLYLFAKDSFSSISVTLSSSMSICLHFLSLFNNLSNRLSQLSQYERLNLLDMEDDMLNIFLNSGMIAISLLFLKLIMTLLFLIFSMTND